MEGGGGLVLVVAGVGQRGQRAVVQVAVDDERLRGHRVGEHLALAAAGGELRGDRVLVAVVGRGAAGGGTALLSNSVEDLLDLGRVGVLEDVAESGVVGRGGLGGSRGKLLAVLHGSGGRGLLLSGAVGEGRALLDLLDLVKEGTADLGGVGSKDVGLEAVAQVGNGTNDVSGVALGVGNGTLGENIKVTTLSEVVHLGHVESGLNALTSGERSEGVGVEVLHAGALAKTIEGNAGLGTVDLGLLNGGLIKERVADEEVQILVTVVGDDGLDLTVVNLLELDVQRSGTPVELNGGGGGHGGQSGVDSGRRKLHGEECEGREMVGEGGTGGNSVKPVGNEES